MKFSRVISRLTARENFIKLYFTFRCHVPTKSFKYSIYLIKREPIFVGRAKEGSETDFGIINGSTQIRLRHENINFRRLDCNIT